MARELFDFVNSGFSEMEKVSQKLNGPISSILTVLKDFEEKLCNSVESNTQEVKLVEHVISRAQSRVSEASLIFDSFRERVLRVFGTLGQRCSDLIDEHLGLYAVVKAKISRRSDKLSVHVREILQEIDFESTLKSVVDEAAVKEIGRAHV